MIPGEFHFLRPLFLLGIPLALVLLWLVARKPLNSTWRQYFSADKLRVLMMGRDTGQTWIMVGLACAWILACLALAGPTWEERPTPTGLNNQPLVVLLDQSPSMLAQDLTPDRLTRARLKLIDLLRERTDGETALIAYAGTPHLVAPLTQDARTIEALLPALSPNVMPQAGSNTEDAFRLALEVLDNAGYSQGDILLITDGVAPEAQRELQRIRPLNVRLSILGVGTQGGAPVPSINGFLRDSRDQIVVAGLNRGELQELARSMAGRYADLQPSDADIRHLLAGMDAPVVSEENAPDLDYDQWYDMGYWLCLLLIPFALYAWRRGMIFALLLGVQLFAFTPESQALDWQDLWLTPDQQGLRALEQEDFERAAESFARQDWKGLAEYRAQDFEAAAESFNALDSTLGLYNLGNALAHQGRIEEAIAAYDQVLQRDPDHADAAHNKAKLEEFLQQQSEQQAQNNQQDGQQNQEQQQQQGENQQSQQDPSSSQQNDSENAGQNQDSPQDQGNQQASDQQQGEQPEEQTGEQQQAEASEEESGEQSQAYMTSTDEPLSPASEQWLRGVPDDPSGLLRRKFQYQSELYRRQQRFAPSAPGSSSEERY